MKTIPLQKAYKLLESAAAIIVEDQALFPNLSQLTGKETHAFLQLEWKNEEGLWFELQFCEGENQSIQISGTSLFLYHTESSGPTDHIQITLLQEKSLE
jgi:hypothetical protein